MKELHGRLDRDENLNRKLALFGGIKYVNFSPFSLWSSAENGGRNGEKEESKRGKGRYFFNQVELFVRKLRLKMKRWFAHWTQDRAVRVQSLAARVALLYFCTYFYSTLGSKH